MNAHDTSKEPVIALKQPIGPAPLLMPSPRKARLFTAVVLVMSVTALIISAIVYAQRAAYSHNANNVMISAKVVAMTDEGWVPRTIKISKGQTVIWTNATTQQRGIGLKGSQMLDGFGALTPLDQGGTYIYTFTQPGTYIYNDPNNGYFGDGKIIVTD